MKLHCSLFCIDASFYAHRFMQVKWVKDLKDAEEYHKSGAHHMSEDTQIQTTILNQRYSVPIPGFADREILMTKV